MTADSGCGQRGRADCDWSALLAVAEQRDSPGILEDKGPANNLISELCWFGTSGSREL